MAKSIDDGKMKSARIFAFVGVADDLQFEKKVRKKAIRDMLVCEASQAGLAERGKSVPKPS